MIDERPWILMDCPFYAEFQQLFDEHVRSIFVTDLMKKEVDELTESDMAASIDRLPVSVSEIAGVVSHQHAPIRAAMLSSLTALRVVSNHGVGHGHIDSAYLRERGLPTGYTPRAPAAPTAELGVGLILASARNLLPSVRKACAPETDSFDPYWYGRGVAGTTLGIIGLGEMGMKLVEYISGFKMRMLYWNRSRKPLELEQRLGVEWCESMPDLLATSDFVVLCVASSPATRGMIGKEELRKMKASATLVNLARGDILKQSELVDALVNGDIGSAALDVTSPEPLPRDHPLLKMDNVIITSHIGSATKTARRKMAEMCLENLLAGLKGMKLPTPVFPQPDGPSEKRQRTLSP